MQKNLLQKFCYAKIFACLLILITCITSAKSQTITWTGKVNTNWNNANNWSPKTVPGITNAVSIPQGLTTYPVISSANALAASVTINNGASLTIHENYILTISNAGILNNNGVFIEKGTVTFAGSGTVSGTISFNDIMLNGAVDLGNSCVINGSLEINANGSVINNIPVYGNASEIIYNTGTTTKTGNEWQTSNALARHRCS